MKQLFVALAILLSSSSIASAAVEVGDKPDLSFQSADGTPISLANLRGKMVIVDFWATWCVPCMAEAPHMVQLKDQYEPKGVRIIGISLDQSKAHMTRIAQEKGLTWPQYFDGKVWQNTISTAWGVGSIPATFIIGPDGDVLWKGHPADGLDQALTKALKEHPPRLLDPKALADATAALDKAEQLVASKDFAAAIKSFAKISADAKSEPTLGTRIESIQKQLEDYATASLDDAEKLIEQKEFGQAVVKLRDLSRLTGLPAAAEASKKMNVLLSKPETKAQIQAAEKAEQEKERVAHAAEAFTNAQKLQSARKDDQAYLAFKSIVSNFPGTPSATEAADEIAKYEKDQAFVKRVSSAAVESKAKAILNIAGNYKAAGKTDLARQKYQSVIDQFPNTPYAETAKKELKDLN